MPGGIHLFDPASPAQASTANGTRRFACRRQDDGHHPDTRLGSGFCVYQITHGHIGHADLRDIKSMAMKTFAAFCLFAFFLPLLQAQPLKTDWAVRVGGDDFILVNAISMQPSGHVLLSGQFTSVIDANPGTGIQWMTSVGNYDAYLIKLDEEGNYVWSKRWGGGGYDDAWAMKTDASGQIFLTGDFGGMVDFNPGGGVANLTSEGGTDVYLLKLNADGEYVWAKHFGGPFSDGPTSLALDAGGQIYLTGYFSNTADFDPGPGQFPLTSFSGSDVFLLKLSAAGNPVWVKQLGGSGNDFSYSVLPDPAGNVYTLGVFQGEADFDPGSTTQMRTSLGGNDIFISKLNATGNYGWIRQIGGEGDDYPQDMQMDQDGNLVITGFFDTELDVDPAAGELLFTPTGTENAFVVKMNAQGQLMWARQIAGESQVISERCAILPDQGIVVTGRFTGTLQLADADTMTFPPLPSAGSQDIFWVRYDADGMPLWVASIGGPNNDGGGTYFDLEADPDGNIYTAGWVRYAIDFDPGPDELILPESEVFEVFLSRMHEVPTSTEPAGQTQPVHLWPNPGSGPVYLDDRQGTHPWIYRVLDIRGQLVSEGRWQPGGVHTLTLPEGEGIWFLHLDDGHGRQIIQRMVRSAR